MDQVNRLFQQFHPDNLLRAVLLLIAGWFLSRLLVRLLSRQLKQRIRPHQLMLIRRMVFVLVFMLFLACAFEELNFHISALLGATGILTVAIGIASQTSMSNLVSGLFLIGEKPFEIGDTIKLDGITGQIISIDSMSVRVCTTENAMVRIPNEVLIKSAFTNLSYFPTRRINMTINVTYQEKIDRVMDVLLKIAHDNPLSLPEPAPAVIVDSFGESGIQLQLQIWTKKEDRNNLQSILQKEIHEVFEKNNIEMPFAARSLYAGDTEEGFPVRIIPSKRTS